VKFRARTTDTETKLEMSAMVDMVFILLVFFVMTFQIVPIEGDLSISMPVGVAPGPIEIAPEIKLLLNSDESGGLKAIRLNDKPMDSIVQVHKELRRIVESVDVATRSEFSLTIQADTQLSYKHTMAAVTAASGYRDGDTIVKLIEKVKFAPPKS
jgi:biopolymer transport protein ExbD